MANNTVKFTCIRDCGISSSDRTNKVFYRMYHIHYHIIYKDSLVDKNFISVLASNKADVVDYIDNQLKPHVKLLEIIYEYDDNKYFKTEIDNMYNFLTFDENDNIKINNVSVNPIKVINY